MKTLSIDIETYSSIDLTKSGVYKYTQNDFEILLIAYAYDDEDIKRLSMIMTLYETDFSKEDIDNAEKLIEEADVVLAQLEIPLDTALYAMKVAKKYGKTTILNPAPAVNLKECDLSDVDILTPNETEARVAVGVPTDSELTNSEIAEMLFKTGCKKIIMTLGDKGSGIFEPGVARQVQPYKIEVVDSNGAGDCFNASLATALAAGKEIDESVLYANAVSALCCTKWETVPSYHTAAEVKEFMKKHGKKEIV